MRSVAAIFFLAAASAWANERPLTWEPARVVHLEEVVASGVLAPTDPHPVFFDFFSAAILESNGSVVFIANGSGQGVSMLGREGVYSIDRDGSPATLVQRGDSFGDGQTAVAAIAALEVRDGVPVARLTFEDGKEETVVLEINEDTRDNPTVPRRTAPRIRKDDRSIYRSGRDGTAQIVADMATRIPELFEGSFTGFGNQTAAFGPWVIFSGSAKTYEGLFAMNMETSRLYLLLDNLAVLGDRRVEDFQISESPRSGADLAVTVSFAGGGSGIYIFRFGDGEGNLLFGS